METSIRFVIFCLVATTVKVLQAFPIDYDINEVSGNSINTNDRVLFRPDTVDDDFLDYGDKVVKNRPQELGVYDVGQKRNIISALRGKKRLPGSDDEEEAKQRFSPILSVDALGNLNGFFYNLASNLNTMENKNLLPNQMRLLGESDSRHNSFLHPSADFINSVRAYQSPKHLRQLMNYQPDTHRDSNFYDPVLRRIGLGK